MELTLRVEAVENHPVQGNGDDLNDNFDNGTDQGPALDFGVVSNGRQTRLANNAYLQPANEGIIHVFLEKFLSFPLFARPAPHVPVLPRLMAVMEDACAD